MLNLISPIKILYLEKFIFHIIYSIAGMEENLKSKSELIDRVSTLKMYLEQGLNIDNVIKKMKISEEDFFQLYELALSDEFNKEIEEFEQSRINDFFNLIENKEKEKEAERKELEIKAKENINPLSALTAEDISDAKVFFFEYSINMSEVKSYYLGSLESICNKYWIKFETSMSEHSILESMKEKMLEKGFHNVRNLKLLEPSPAYSGYLKELKSKKKKDIVKFEIDGKLLTIARKKIGL